jgi:hypothetical protein
MPDERRHSERFPKGPLGAARIKRLRAAAERRFLEILREEYGGDWIILRDEGSTAEQNTQGSAKK